MISVEIDVIVRTKIRQLFHNYIRHQLHKFKRKNRRVIVVISLNLIWSYAGHFRIK